MRFKKRNVELNKEINRLEKEVERLKAIVDRFDDDRVYEEINDYWDDQMPMMAMEEAGEFIQAVSKLERALKDKDDPDYDIIVNMAKDNLAIEMADMHISMGALMVRYEMEKMTIDEAINNKLSKKY